MTPAKRLRTATFRPRLRALIASSWLSRNTIISFPGLLKHVLDTNLKEYVHKAVGVCGVSVGPFGGARMIQSLVPVLRELGLVPIFWDVYFGTAGKLFDPATGKITDPAYVGRLAKFLNELVWMARALRYARENIPAA